MLASADNSSSLPSRLVALSLAKHMFQICNNIPFSPTFATYLLHGVSQQTEQPWQKCC